MTPAEVVYQGLQSHADDLVIDGWADVLISLARPDGMSEEAFRRVLVELGFKHLYRPRVERGWGQVWMKLL